MNQNPTLRLLFFGKSAEITGCHERTCNYCSQLVQLQTFLFETYPQLKSVGFVIAVNRKIVTTANLQPNDEIAILPPFSGG
jgi:molybdopterin converting factor small subunit